MREPEAIARERRDELRSDVLLIALLVLSSLAGLVFGGAKPTLVVVGGICMMLAQVPVVLARRRYPRAALGAWLVLVGATSGIEIPVPSFTAGVLAFAVQRGPRRSAGFLWAALGAQAVVTGLAWWPAHDTGPLSGLFPSIGAGIGGAGTTGLVVLVGAVAARVSRTVRERDVAERDAADAGRLAEALADERARIADEVGSGVLAGLRRLVDRVDALPGRDTPSELASLREEASGVLAGMRRVLGALRGADPVPAAEAPEPAADRRLLRRFPLPTRSGVLVATAIGVLAVAVAALPKAPIGSAYVDPYLALLDLPAGPAAAFLLVELLSLLWWRSAPAAALLVATVGACGAGLLGDTNQVVETSWMVLVYAAALGSPPRRSIPVTAVCTLVVLVGYLVSPVWNGQLPTGAVGTAMLVTSYGVVPLLWTVGAHRRWVRGAAETERRARAARRRERAVAEERLRVARELHDVVAHHVSALTVQAGAASVTGDAGVRAEAMEQIAASGRRIAAALPELGGLTPETEGIPLTEAGLAALVAPAREAGVPVRVSVEADRPEGRPPGDAELFAQRIVVEALTNVVRHAGPSPTRVEIRQAADEVVLAVHDSGPVRGHHDPAHGSGLGLVGMRERAALLGGSLDAGRAPDGGWTVRARLPRGSEAPAHADDGSGPPPRGGPARDDLVLADDATGTTRFLPSDAIATEGASHDRAGRPDTPRPPAAGNRHRPR